MGSSAMVWVLVMFGYNSVTNEITTHEVMSYHISPSDCIQEKTWQNDRGRAETFNRQYVCLDVYDADMRARVQAAHGNAGGNGYRSGGRIVIKIK